jgi:hypothetical protein
MRSEMRLTGKIQPRLTVWHSSYNIRQDKKKLITTWSSLGFEF